MLICVQLDFTATGEDEITFKKGETIVVIARDDGFGDGWWTVRTLLPLSLSFLHSHLFIYDDYTSDCNRELPSVAELWAVPRRLAYVRQLAERMCHPSLGRVSTSRVMDGWAVMGYGMYPIFIS
jgi:hypothetical protein